MEKTVRIKLPHLVIVRSPGLLPMLYTLREMCDELGVPDSTLRDWLQAGAPHQRDSRDHVWIHGENFAAWVKAQQKQRQHRKLLADEGYCMHCNQITQLISPVIIPIKGKLIHIRGKCPQCGHTINRGARYDRTAELS
jgi:hypothetical protein